MVNVRPSQGPAEQLVALAILFFGGIIISSFVAPLLWELVVTVDPDVRWPFPRVFRRIAMLAALISFWILRAPLQLSEIGRRLRSDSRTEKLTRLAVGTVLTFVTAAIAIPLIVASSSLERSGLSTYEIAFRLTRSIPGAILGSFLEESFFRAAIFCGLARHLKFLPAASISSLLYACVHFITPPKGFTVASASPLEGFSILTAILGHLFRAELLPVIIGLFLVGMILCFTISLTGSLSLSIGLHAGWFLAAKLAVFALSNHGGNSVPTRYILLAHPWSWVSMVLALGILVLFFRRRKHQLDADGLENA